MASVHLDLNLYLIQSNCDHTTFSNTSQNVTEPNKMVLIINKIKAHLVNLDEFMMLRQWMQSHHVNSGNRWSGIVAFETV